MIDVVVTCLASITHPRFYQTERGFQGELLALLSEALPNAGLPGNAIVEQEYQKRLREHGIRKRPDIIVHVPTPEGGNRRHGNFAAFELKLSARPAAAQAAFASLDALLEALDYPLGIFINIASERTHAELYEGPFSDRVHFFAVRPADGLATVRHAFFRRGRIVEGL